MTRLETRRQQNKKIINKLAHKPQLNSKSKVRNIFMFIMN